VRFVDPAEADAVFRTASFGRVVVDQPSFLRISLLRFAVDELGKNKIVVAIAVTHTYPRIDV